MTPSLTVHAELLPNIRQTTLYISLPADTQLQSLEPTISLSESRRAVTVSLPAPFDHVSETIKLPARVHEASRRVLVDGRQRAAGTQEGSKGDNGNREMSFRMQIDPADAACLVPGEEVTGDYVPWMAGDMGPLTRLRCRGCENVVLDSKCSGFSAAPADNDVDGTASTGRVWKDLPSGNWAEMMDFWHCHKPDSHDHGHGDNTVSIEERNSQVKGYGAANQVVAARGTVLVDVPTFLVAGSDCTGLNKIQNETPGMSKKASIVCDKCDALVGMEDITASGWRLLKANLAASTAPPPEKKNEAEETVWRSHPMQTVVAAQLLELVERESARRLVVHCGQKEGLLLWVFNPDLRYSNASTDHSVTAQRGMKILFQEVSDAEAMLNPESGQASSLSLEELELPSNIFAAVRQALGDSNGMLPMSARSFREWRVGILDRYER